MQASLSDSLARMKLERVDLFFLDNMIVVNEDQVRYEGTPRGLFAESVIPAFEKLKKGVGDYRYRRA